ncbi:hypothetical protein ACIGXM_31010 [Kitasatospora sp. NPDC052896]|uniref:hypothetical protein n=1 Tax=Kitasatospora sp. NPDC052896 TaxID=3364061 RepID=UPI0037C97A32
MTIRTYRITTTGERIDLAPEATYRADHRGSFAPLGNGPCACPRCGRTAPQEYDRGREAFHASVANGLRDLARSPLNTDQLPRGPHT